MSAAPRPPFFRPLWRRVLVVTVCLLWSGLEWANGETAWGVLTLFLAGYGVWAFFLDYDPQTGGSRRGGRL